MQSLIIFILSSILLVGVAQMQTSADQAPVKQYLAVNYYNDCEGADAANYTLYGVSMITADCSRITSAGVQRHLIQTSSNNQRSVMSLQELAGSVYPDGAYNHIEALFLVTNGALEARYIYERVITLSSFFLKKCSSVLGYSIASSKSAMILFSQNLDLNIFLDPNGAFEAFKRSSTTICRGRLNAL